MAQPTPTMGSSPLTRGGRRFHYWCACWPGLIPAYAGRTTSADPQSAPGQAHPRLRGADFFAWAQKAGYTGSSPLTRGGPLEVEAPVGVDGLIPAYAGRTKSWRGLLIRMGAHPRLRGADRFTPNGKSVVEGSSPLTRGGRGRRTRLLLRLGLIPAYAGRTVIMECAPLHSGAHPRLRGAD